MVARFLTDPGDRDPAELDGAAVPWDALRDCPCFDGQDWVVHGALRLVHDETLVAELRLHCESKPKKRDLAELIANAGDDFSANDVDMQWVLPNGEDAAFVPTSFDEKPTVRVERV